MTAKDSLDPLDHQDTIRHIAYALRNQLTLRTPIEDLIQFGNTGLLEAMQRYDPASGVSVTTFAYHRIRGAILDGARSDSGLKRSQTRAITRQRRAESFMESHADAAAARTDQEFVTQAIRGVLFATSLCDVVEERVAGESEGDSHYTQSPERAHARAELRALVHRVIAELPPDEARVLHGHYIEDRSLQEIGDSLGLSRSWMSRLHTRALERAQAILRDEHDLDISDV